MRHLCIFVLGLILCRPALAQSIVVSGGGGSVVISGASALGTAQASLQPIPDRKFVAKTDYSDRLEIAMDNQAAEIEMLKAQIDELRALAMPKPAKVASPIETVKHIEQTRSVNMSHSEMVALHNSLHGGGSGDWTWPGDLGAHLRGASHNAGTTKNITTSETIKALAASVDELYDGIPNSSHRDRHSLIDHLMKSKAHIGKHNRQDLLAMSDQELSELHTGDHYELGQVKISAPVMMQSNRSYSSSASNCPNGVCPQPAYRGTGRSRRSRR